MRAQTKKLRAANKKVAALFGLDEKALKERGDKRTIYRALERIGIHWNEVREEWKPHLRPWMHEFLPEEQIEVTTGTSEDAGGTLETFE